MRNIYDNLIKIKNLYLFFFFIFSQLFSIRFFFTSKYVVYDPFVSWIIYILGSILIFLFILNNKIIGQLFFNKIFFIIIVILFTIFTFYLYPIADGMKDYGLGSDQDDCFRIIIKNIYNLQLPYYHNTTYLGNPCSTGIIELILYFPIIFWDNYFCLIPTLSILITFFIIRNLTNSRISIILHFIQMSNLVFIEMAITGSDFLIIAALYNLGFWCIYKMNNNNNKFYFFTALFALIFFYGSRVMFLFAIPLNFILIILYSFGKNLKLMIAILIIPITSYLFFVLFDFNNKSVFHLFSKSNWLIHQNIILLIFFILAILLIFLYYKIKLKLTLQSINSYFLILNSFILIIPIIFFILAGFSGMSNIPYWETLNYFTIILPSLMLIVSLLNEKKIIKISYDL